MPIADVPIFTSYNKERFIQFSPEDCANWYNIENDRAKKGAALYPVSGRKHVTQLNGNILNFDVEPRYEYKSVNFSYFFVAGRVIRYDLNFNSLDVTPPTDYNTTQGKIYFDFIQTPGFTLACFSDGNKLFVHNEQTANTLVVTDPAISGLLITAIRAFGNRLVVTSLNSPLFYLSLINLGGVTGSNITASTCFGGSSLNSIFASEVGNIVDFAVLHNTLYIFTPYITGIWSNIPSTITNTTTGLQTTFPWRKNTTYDFDYGLASPDAWNTDFGLLVWLGRNKNGLVQVMATNGQAPLPISTHPIEVLLQRDNIAQEADPFLDQNISSILYQYEGTIFYRLSYGQFLNLGTISIEDEENSLEYNFNAKKWGRCIEANGERSRVKRHLFFSNKHLVTVEGDTSVYEFAGNIYYNEIRNPDQPDVQAANAFIQQPMRYELVTPLLSEPDYGERMYDWLQIDFVWGVQDFVFSNTPFENTVFIVDENGVFITDENGAFIIQEGTNTPELNSTTYYNWFKPQIELFISDDGGISFYSADVLEFSQLGVYRWRMRWYQLGVARNRAFKLVCVSPAPIVILGAVMSARRVSDGAA